MRQRVYLETTISYLTGLPSRDLIVAAHQQITRDWWVKRARFDLFVSQAVLRECSVGDTDAAARRMSALEGLPVLELRREVTDLARDLIAARAIPKSAELDAIHVAVATVSGMDFLLTWNCTHIANAALRSRIEEVCTAGGVRMPVICTPEELLEE